jgi:Ribonuclease G/E
LQSYLDEVSPNLTSKLELFKIKVPIFESMGIEDEIAKLTREDFNALGIKELLTAQRQNGLGNLITRIVGLAQ